MIYAKEEAVRKLLASFKAYYNIEVPEGKDSFHGLPLAAVCEYYEHSEKYILHKKAEVWSAECEEFLFLFETDILTEELYEQCQKMAYEEGMKRAHIGPGHMYTYITPVFICEQITPEAAKALKKCHIYKNFRFSFYGWMDFHVAAYETKSGKIATNRSGRCLVKTLQQVLPAGGKTEGAA